MENITLESLIAEQKQRIPTLHECEGFPFYQYDNWEDYQKWLAKTIRFLNISYPNDKYVMDFEKMSGNYLVPTQQNALLAILEAIASMPTIVPVESKVKNRKTEPITIKNTINNSNSQSQSQEQSFAVNMFLEAIKDDLTGKQVKEIKEILTEAANDKEQARKSISEKLKSFGSDVASNIVANIITNPMIWSCL
jgi:hypothetical protein